MQKQLFTLLIGIVIAEFTIFSIRNGVFIIAGLLGLHSFFMTMQPLYN
jgi:hypothetical protein